jgi:hypothetical protein
MNIDTLMTKAFNWVVNSEKKSFKEGDTMLDNLYDSYPKDSDLHSDWRKFQSYMTILVEAMKLYEKNPNRYDSPQYIKSDRRSRTKLNHTVIANKEEWDIILYVITKLMNINSEKKLKLTGDVITNILTEHYSKVSPSGIDPIFDKKDTEYGLSTRVNSRTYSEINDNWFPVWKYLFDMNPTQLNKFGIKFE